MIAAIDRSLELVAARVGDPTPLVYARLFARLPEMEPLFARDADGAIKGHMLQEAIEAARDLVSARSYGPHFVANEWVNHQNLGVPAEAYGVFYDAIVETFRVALGDAWDGEMDRAWAAVIADVAAITAARGLMQPVR